MHSAYYKSIEDDKNEISEALISDIGKLDLVEKLLKKFLGETKIGILID